MESAGPNAIWLWLTVVPFIAGCLVLLLYIAVPQSWRRKRPPVIVPVVGAEIPLQSYSKIGVALDYGSVDARVLSHARTLASLYHAELCLFHIVEGISGQLFGKNAYDTEAREDLEQLERTANRLRGIGLNVSVHLGYGRVPKQLVQLTKETGVDLLVMGGHGHRGLDDILYGTSISAVRHALSIPVLVVQ